MDELAGFNPTSIRITVGRVLYQTLRVQRPSFNPTSIRITVGSAGGRPGPSREGLGVSILLQSGLPLEGCLLNGTADGLIVSILLQSGLPLEG